MAAQGSGSRFEMLQTGISSRQQELQRVADILARAAQRQQRRAAWVRVLLILCGAVAATQSAWEQAFAGYKDHAFLVFTALGVMVSALAGLEAAFKFEARGAALSLLAASCHSTVRKADATWYRQVGIADDADAQVAGAMALIELQDSKLSELQEKATASGVNITLEVRELYRRTDDPHAGEAHDTAGQPYPA